MLSDRSLSCLYVCDVGVLWPNGWMDQDETWHGGRPQTRPCCARRGPSSTKRGTALQYSAHVCCGQMNRWIKMPLGTEVGPGPGHTVLDGDPPPPQKKGRAQHLHFWPLSVVAKGLDGARCHLVWRQALTPHPKGAQQAPYLSTYVLSNGRHFRYLYIILFKCYK